MDEVILFIFMLIFALSAFGAWSSSEVKKAQESLKICEAKLQEEKK